MAQNEDQDADSVNFDFEIDNLRTESEWDQFLVRYTFDLIWDNDLHTFFSFCRPDGVSGGFKAEV